MNTQYVITVSDYDSHLDKYHCKLYARFFGNENETEMPTWVCIQDFKITDPYNSGTLKKEATSRAHNIEKFQDYDQEYFRIIHHCDSLSPYSDIGLPTPYALMMRKLTECQHELMNAEDVIESYMKDY